MRDESIARNYSEALLELARRANAATEWGVLINAVAGAIESDVMLQRFLAAPQISGDQKIAVIGKALGDKAPAMFVRFLQKLVTNRRQTLIPEIATEYGNLLDAAEGRVHARVTVARNATEADTQAIAAALSKAMGKSVVPHVAVDERILGGVIVKFGDTVMDGSVRKRLENLRNRMVLGR
jgi:F-type H+-transporting ATPase subunit delta